MAVHIGVTTVDVASVERDVSRGTVDDGVVDLRSCPVTCLERVEHPTCGRIKVTIKQSVTYV